MRIAKQIVVSKLTDAQHEFGTAALNKLDSVRLVVYDKCNEMMIVTPADKANIDIVFLQVSETMARIVDEYPR